MKYKGLYINLDRSPERRASIEAQLADHELANYARFTATDGNQQKFPNPSLTDSEIGCFISHFRILNENRDAELPLHIIEDDIILSPQTGQVLNWAISSGQLVNFDMIYTDVAVPLLNDVCHSYKAFYDAAVRRDAAGKIANVTFTVIDMRELIFASMCSFLVNPKSITKLATLYETELSKGATLPVDIFLRQLCRERKVSIGCIFPFVTSIPPESCYTTTMSKRFEELPALAANMLRHSFFIGCDWQQCLDRAITMFPQPAADDVHRQLMMRLLGYSLLPEYNKV